MLTEKSLLLEKPMRQALVEVLTGGNHLASVLINRLGTGEDTFPIYDTPIEFADKLLSGENLDLWFAWRSIMHLREAMRMAGLYE